MTSEENVLWGALRNEIPKDKVRNGLGDLILVKDFLLLLNK